ncbi:MAG: DsrE family protein [Acidimicrobiia bacterium]|nr:DsrE family protein [Acidimicrobiia bacterium]
MTTIVEPRLIDRRGKTISTFVAFDVATEIRAMREGEVLEVLTDDTELLERDIAAWCDTTGNRMLSSEATSEGRRFRIEKGHGVDIDKSLAMIISVDGLEELLSPLGFALGAALEGVDVHLYFQGPAVHVLAKGFRPKLGGWGRPFSRFAAASMTKTGHIPAQDKLRQIRSLGGKFYVCGGSMDHFKVDREDLIFDDLPVIAYLTFTPIMAEADVQLYL